MKKIKVAPKTDWHRVEQARQQSEDPSLVQWRLEKYIRLQTHVAALFHSNFREHTNAVISPRLVKIVVLEGDALSLLNSAT